MEIYIQKNLNDEFIDDFAFYAYMGLKNDHNIFFFNDISQVPINKMVVGRIDDTITYFKMCNITPPNPLEIPIELHPYLKRSIQILKFEDFLKQDMPKGGIFVKPYSTLKLFPSGVIKNQSSKFNGVLTGGVEGGIKMDELVLTSEVVDMISEYRVFVNRGKIVGMKHYLGDYEVFPDMSIIKSAILDYNTNVISYSIDFAINDKGETILIELNDGWSIGPYGLDAEIYGKFLKDRWLQIFKYTI